MNDRKHRFLTEENKVRQFEIIRTNVVLAWVYFPLAAMANQDSSDNPYGISALWGQSDIVAKTTFLILLLMSMASWYVIVVKYIEQRKMFRSGQRVLNRIQDGQPLDAVLDHIEPNSPYAYMGAKVSSADEHFSAVQRKVDFNTWVLMVIDNGLSSIQGRMQSGLSVLATVGSTAPFVGLFGTVWGIYHALVKIGLTGQASIDKVAGPVGESLIMTAIGLAVAVPAVLGYNWMVRRNKQVLDEIRSFSDELHVRLLMKD